MTGAGPAGLRHASADERDQRSGCPAHPQPPRRAVRRRWRHRRRGHGPAPLGPEGTDGKTPLVTNQACFGCTIACGRIQKIDQNHFTVENKPKYWGASGGLEYEAAWALGAANGVKDLDTLQYANVLCNEHGMDPITFGATIGAVMELYDMGVLTKEQIGIDAQFGSAQAALAYFAEITAKGEGFGKEIGQGSKRLCEKYGHPELSMSVKGQEFPAYDARGIQGIGLAYATSNRGACHLRGYTIASEVLGIPVKTDPLESERQARAGQSLPGRHRRLRLGRPVHLHQLCLGSGRCAAPGGGRLRPRVHAGEPQRPSASGSGTWSATSTTSAGFTSKDDSLPTAPAERGSQDRAGQGHGQQAARDAAQVLRRPRLGCRRPAEAGHARTPGPVSPRH